MQDKKALFEAIQDNLQWIDRTNEMITLHRENNSGELMISQYQEKRQQFLVELSELMQELNIEIKMPLKKAN